MASTSAQYRSVVVVRSAVAAALIACCFLATGCADTSGWGSQFYTPTASTFAHEDLGSYPVESLVPSSVEPSAAAERLTAMERSIWESGTGNQAVYDGVDPGSTVTLVATCSVPTSATFEAQDGTEIWDSLKPTDTYWVVVSRTGQGTRCFTMRRGEAYWQVSDHYPQIRLHVLDKYSASETTPSEVVVLRTDGAQWFIVRRPDGRIEAVGVSPIGPLVTYIEGVKIEEGVGYDPRMVFVPFEVRE